MRRDQITIGYGPSRYKGPKAIKRELDNLPKADLGDLGGGFTQLLTVTTYNPANSLGSGTTEDGQILEFLNTTPSSLTPNDEVIIIEIDDLYYAIGIAERSGTITPVPLPAAAALSPNFPIVTQPDLTFDLTTQGVESSSIVLGYSLAHDMAGGFGIGTDTIIGKDGNTTVNAFTRSNSVNSSLFATALGIGFARDTYIQQGNGTVILSGNNGTYHYRRPGDVVWSSFLATNGNDWNAFDHLTENMWTYSYIGIGTGPSDFYRMSDTDTAPVYKGNLNVSPDQRTVTFRQKTSGVATLTTAADHQLYVGMTVRMSGVDAAFNGDYTVTGTPTSTTFTYTRSGADVALTASSGTVQDISANYNAVLVAGHGYLAAIKFGAISTDTSYLYLKNANDDSDFTFVATFSNSAFYPQVDCTWLGSLGTLTNARDLRITPNGDITYIYKNTTTSTWHLKLLEQSTGIVFDYDTNIPNEYTSLTYTRDALQGHMHTSSGLVILQGVADDVTLGASTPGFYPATAAYNYVSSTYIYYDPDLPDDMSTATHIVTDTPIEIATGVIRFMYRSNTDQNGAIPAQDRVYELTGV